MSLEIVDCTLGNIDTFLVGARTVERVAVTSDAMAKRILRLATSRGDLGIRLEDTRLRDGDVVYADNSRVIVVAVEAEDLLIAAPRTVAEAFELGHLLGNRHKPVQVWNERVVVAYDPLLEELFDARNIPFERERMRLTEPFRHAHAPHSHGDA